MSDQGAGSSRPELELKRKQGTKIRFESPTFRSLPMDSNRTTAGYRMC
jgi:hypothetical protein